MDSGMTTAGECRYRRAIPVGLGGRLDVDVNYGIQKAFLLQVIVTRTNLLISFT
ncbi:unnamed protein product [Lupinus luteus]|uniref:Uncharacterized protein n=1 Tax=Lupinus luteus TaxID=3873 RepID=A0AAV1WAE1_LUPLU